MPALNWQPRHNRLFLNWTLSMALQLSSQMEWTLGITRISHSIISFQWRSALAFISLDFQLNLFEFQLHWSWEWSICNFLGKDVQPSPFFMLAIQTFVLIQHYKKAIFMQSSIQLYHSSFCLVCHWCSFALVGTNKALYIRDHTIVCLYSCIKLAYLRCFMDAYVGGRGSKV